MLCQLEVPVEAVAAAAAGAFFCLNAAPARPCRPRPARARDLVVANRYELEALGGARG